MSFKVARYKCCRNIVMSCVSGMEDEETEQDFADYAKKGLSIETIESMDGEKFAKCSCEKISRAEYDRLIAVEGEYQRVSALVRGICESARNYSGNDEYKPYSVQRLEYALKQISELMPAAIARAKGEKRP